MSWTIHSIHFVTLTFLYLLLFHISYTSFLFFLPWTLGGFSLSIFDLSKEVFHRSTEPEESYVFRVTGTSSSKHVTPASTVLSWCFVDDFDSATGIVLKPVSERVNRPCSESVFTSHSWQSRGWAFHIPLCTVNVQTMARYLNLGGPQPRTLESLWSALHHRYPLVFFLSSIISTQTP